MWFTFYRLDDGILTGAQAFVQPLTAQRLVELTPAGCGSIAGQHDHQQLRMDLAAGKLVLWTPSPPSPAELAALAAQRIKAQRDQLLAASDWRAARAFELGEPMPAAWRAYRQALRDLPDQPGFPLSVSWPDLPA